MYGDDDPLVADKAGSHCGGANVLLKSRSVVWVSDQEPFWTRVEEKTLP